ncbi:MAG: hypothetical protein V1899_09690 [Planctomycetota bacterium]
MNKTKLIIFIVSAIIASFIANFTISSLKPEIDSELMKSVSEINKNCPFMVDKFTRLDNTVAGYKELIRFSIK